MTYRALFAALLFLTFGLTARADTIFVRGREKPANGEVKSEDAKSVVITVKKVDEAIPALDVIDIHYESVGPAALRLSGGAYKTAKEDDKVASETADPVKRKAALASAIAKYGETLKTMTPSKYAARNMEYRIAILTLKQATAEQLGTAKALAKLQDFRERFPNSWQINQVMPLIAQLQIEAGDTTGAEKTFQDMADMETLPPEVRRDADLMTVKVLIRGNKIAEAEKKLDGLAKKAAGNPGFASRVKMARAEVLVAQKKLKEAVPILQQVVRENNDKTIKAIAHNTLGECLFKAENYNEALWEFLWVDAVYNQDKNEHARALYFLWKTFVQVPNGAERAQECLQSLLNDRQLTGTEYQRKALAETK